MQLKSLLIIFLSFYCLNGNAQNESATIYDIIQETQIWNKDQNNMKLVWWIPTKYWEAATKGDPSVTPEAINQIMDVLDEYTLFAALNVNVTPFGTFIKDTFSITLEVANKKVYTSIAKDSIKSDTKRILDVLKPLLSNSIGALGESFEFHVFPRNDSSNQKIANPFEKGTFTVLVNSTEFVWELPLSTFVPELICPKDSVLMNGKWKYCPWHGVELKTNTLPKPTEN